MQHNKLKVISLFTGCGGLDLGFHLAGFDTIWANEYDRTIWDTIQHNFPKTYLDKRSIVNVPCEDVPNDITGIIGGPPCQSWSEAGAQRGFDDSRGQLFNDYIRILEDKQPAFFLAENVSGMTHKKHANAFENIQNRFKNAGYRLTQHLVNAHDYNNPQDRKRVFFIGFRNDLGLEFTLPPIGNYQKTLKDAIWDLRQNAKPALDKNKANTTEKLKMPNHEYMIGGFSTMYMSRNRVRSWGEPSFTIQAGGRHAPIHPNAPKMIKVGEDKFEFIKGKESLYRRLSVRECARIQSFPDDFILKYQYVADGYKMIGNAVPVNLAYAMAKQIKQILMQSKIKKAA